MSTPARGRPPASSREVLADAALELFLEQGYEATSVTEITRRVGVSRASFFNYFASKPETLWFVLDRRIEVLTGALLDPQIPFAEALTAAGAEARPDTLALAIVDARTMGVEAELARGRADRQQLVAAAVAARLVRDGAPQRDAEIVGAGYAAALFAAVWTWAAKGAGRYSLTDEIGRAVTAAHRLLRPELVTLGDPETRSSAQ
ncbi:AcrR family transcriptional regulator [Leucobacter exalbidus]|uniref:AcrR family transcriptional regulator n=1 Tax=Leucobacter exalbidus TaxID=662960 RepID=A0A940T577_9MICO|nr:TetR/AcrR family transcriptional regulator [Leucobacter exalbidus]MBP1325711.1 AcrR family transcriptional regulator [Leucobacter exalbidus]